MSDAVEDGVNGYLVPPGNYDPLVDALLSMGDNEGTISACQNHARQFDWDVFDTKLLQKTSEVIDG